MEVVVFSNKKWATEGDVESQCEREGGGGALWSYFQHHQCGQRHTGGQLLLLHAAEETASLQGSHWRRAWKIKPQPTRYFFQLYTKIHRTRLRHKHNPWNFTAVNTHVDNVCLQHTLSTCVCFLANCYLALMLSDTCHLVSIF